jgi:thiol-disulfide isomerase/thioredoxin
MKSPLTALLSMILFVILLADCERRKIHRTVSIKVKTAPGSISPVKLITHSITNLEQLILQEAAVDSTGTAIVEFPLSRPILATLQIGEEQTPVYLEPGYDLEVSFEKDSGKPFSLKGKGSHANNYLAESFLIRRRVDVPDGTFMQDLDSAAFFHQLDTLKNALENFHRNYTDTVSLPEHVVDLFEKRNSIILLEIKQNYIWNYSAGNHFKFPKGMDAMDDIPFDTTLLNHGSPEYSGIAMMNLHMKIYMPMLNNAAPEIKDSLKTRAAVVAHRRIHESEFDPGLKEWLRAMNIDYWLSMNGISPETDSLYNEFARQSPDWPGLALLTKRYDKWLTLSPGKPAPDFSGYTFDGRKVSLSDLRGKIVYVDIWATWCGPCVGELPHLKALKGKFEGDEEVSFVLFSVDKDREAWKKKVVKDMKGLGNYNIVDTSKSGPSPIMQAYMVRGIPQYLLIDQSGNIVNVNAPRPSEGNVTVEAIRKLLKRTPT